MCSRLGDDLQHLEDGLQTKEDDFDMMKDDETCYFLSINKDWLNPFKCSETIGNYEGWWYRLQRILNYKGKMVDVVNRTEGDLQTTKDDLQTTEDDPPSI